MTFTYDLLGNLASATDSDSALTFAYDALGRLTQAATGATSSQPATTLAYTYDQAGNRVSMTDPQGAVTNYAYDVLNRLTSLASPQGTTNFTYDALARRTALTLPNGARATSTYDAASQLTRLLNQGPGASPVTLSDFAYTYDAGGNRTTRTTTNGIASYTYDALNRLTQASQPDPIDPLRQVPEAFAYDPVGNRTASHLATGQVHDAANRLLEDSTFTNSYDANGNLVTKTAKATGAITTYTYDAENRLTRVQTSTLTATYRYDALGRRIAKEITQAGTLTVTRYIYDNEDILLELDGTNVLQARYSHGPGIDEPLIMLRGTQAFFFHPDGLGSIWDLTDAAGTVARSYTYDSFGNILAQPGTVANPYTYTGREADPETGLYFYQARYYDSATGRFTSEDPLGLRGSGNNLYAYVGNQPVDYIDPTGLASFVACRPLRGAGARLGNHCFLIVEQPSQDTKILSLFPRANSPANILQGGPLVFGQRIEGAGADDIRKRDINLTFFARLEPPRGVCEDVFDETIIQTFNSYLITRYSLFRQNSNTFAGDIIQRSGGTLPPGLTEAVAPGILGQQPDTPFVLLGP